MSKAILSVAFVAQVYFIVSASAQTKGFAPQKEAPKCSELEELNLCSNGGCYKERRCADIILPAICSDVSICIPGCLCKEGYLRNGNGECIAKSECPEKLKCPRQNEAYYPCAYRVSNAGNETCTGDCLCEPEYYKNEAGDCIPKANHNKVSRSERSTGSASSQTPKCDELEESHFCANGGCYKERTCADINLPAICLDVLECIPGCICKEGYLRIEYNGKCIPRSECPEKLKCPRQNEAYKCVKKCESLYKHCENIYNFTCPFDDVEETCVEECVCEPDHYRNKVGDCISEENCNKVSRSERSTGSASSQTPKCDELEESHFCANGGCYKERTCADINLPAICLDVLECIPGCICKEGYLRIEYNGKCIPRSECPEKLKCPRQNEAYKCVKKCESLYKHCENIYNFTCPFDDVEETCVEECVCEPDHYRNKVGDCISEENCTRHSRNLHQSVSSDWNIEERGANLGD